MIVTHWLGPAIDWVLARWPLLALLLVVGWFVRRELAIARARPRTVAGAGPAPRFSSWELEEFEPWPGDGHGTKAAGRLGGVPAAEVPQVPGQGRGASWAE